MLIAAIIAVCLGGLQAFWLLDAQRERAAADKIQRLGGCVYYAWRLDECIQLSAGQHGGWLIRGDGFVSGVSLAGCSEELLEERLACLKSFRKLRWIDLSGIRLTDAALEHIAGQSQLNWLSLHHTQITDAGLQQINPSLPLKWLDLSYTLVTDDGLSRLAALNRLEGLDLRGTRVTRKGLARMRQELPAVRIRADFDDESSAT
jgi:hypothetical protein